jgi:hypothetical protein
MPESSKIKSVIAIISNPSGRGDRGQCEQGNYFVRDGVLTMCDLEGVPVRDANTGRRIELGLLPGDDEKALAKRLTLKMYRAANRDELAGFHRPIRYRNSAY